MEIEARPAIAGEVVVWAAAILKPAYQELINTAVAGELVCCDGKQQFLLEEAAFNERYVVVGYSIRPGWMRYKQKDKR